ncbi:cell division protein ZipA [Pseudoalteromonas sp. MMG010]|uniref:cell division protein ZipA n=1 Tax=Pseudoalteromonas sp. MMG010 TaxID=2822685 RepID=UPI001B3A5751|nr:cell division protein ZipA [Pseudoalteromonas sp. MMG010]MBQ4834544.1 cell division protein ZipA [Pseudoalteromonas sp. MMG010]
MAEELRWVLIVISIFVIGGLLIHGLWSVRKKDSVDEQLERVEPSSHTNQSAHNDFNEPVSVSRDEPQIGDIELSSQVSDEIEQPIDEQPVAEADPEPENESADNVAVSDFVIVHIQMPEGLSMQGSKLLPCITTLGFKYSEEGFFNRHTDPAGQGAILFRLVNMYNPGTFDIDNMEQFSTAGVSLFMTLPCEGDGLGAFNMLHSAAKKLADEFGAQILDAERNEMSVDRVRQYVEQVRAFSA